MIINQLFRVLIFAFLYGAAVTFICVTVREFPIVIHIENSIFDHIQNANYLKPENKLQYHRRDFTEALKKVWLIDLDEDMYRDQEMDKVKIALLLSSVGKIPSLKAIYLDYLYAYASPDARDDTILIRTMTALDDKLVLPFAHTFQRSGTYFEYLDSSAVSCQTKLIFNGKEAGYNSAERLPGDPKLRYLRLEIPSRKSYSCAYLLAEKTNPVEARRVASDAKNPQMEINFICNNPSSNMKGVYHTTKSSQLLRGPKFEIAKIVTHKPELMLIGHFSNLKNASCQVLDIYPTPINPEMFGTMVTLNSWVNIVTKGHLRRSSMGTLFLFNLILGCLGGIWVVRFPDSGMKPFGVLILEFVGTVLLVTIAIMTLYLNWHIKLGFVIPLLAFVKCEFWARKWFQTIGLSGKGGVE